jgi:hypothetical protein
MMRRMHQTPCCLKDALFIFEQSLLINEQLSDGSILLVARFSDARSTI